jgi:two-component system nitrate/nitrite response regulator NarL
LIVDDHVLFADAISPVLQRQGLDVIGVVTNGADALNAARRDQPDAVLIDIGLPDQSGLVIGSGILEERPTTVLIAVTALEDARLVKEAAKVGFRGYLTKASNLPQFVSSVRAILEGEMMFPKRMMRGDGTASSVRQTSFLANQLTAREREVLALLSRGATSQSIADALDIAPNTVRTHVQNVLSKLQVHSRLEAVAFAISNGVVDGGGGSPPIRAASAY